MTGYIFKATDLIAESFEKRGIKFSSYYFFEDDIERLQIILHKDGIPPGAVIKFSSTDNDNDVAVRIFSLVSRTPLEKRLQIIEECNELNRKYRFATFFCDKRGSIHMRYSFPIHTPDEGVGEMAYEIFIRYIKILNDDEYNVYLDGQSFDDKFDIMERDEFSEEQGA